MSLEHGEKRWKVLGTEIVAKYRVFQIIEEKAVSPRTGDERVFHLVDRPPCVQVIAHVADGRFVMVEQYRPGAREMTLEFPAGVIDGEEQPIESALRELREETGYVASAGAVIGTVQLDPALQTNPVHVVDVGEVKVQGEREQDDGEDVHVRLVTADEIGRFIRSGVIVHAGTIAGWFLYSPASL